MLLPAIQFRSTDLSYERLESTIETGHPRGTKTTAATAVGEVVIPGGLRQPEPIALLPQAGLNRPAIPDSPRSVPGPVYTRAVNLDPTP